MNVVRYKHGFPFTAYQGLWHIDTGGGAICGYGPVGDGWTRERHPDSDAPVTCKDCVRIYAERREHVMGGLYDMMRSWGVLANRSNEELADLLMEHVIGDTEITSPFYALYAEIHERLKAEDK